MEKIKKQLIILLAVSVIIGGGLPNNQNPNNYNDPADNPIGVSDSEEKEDKKPDNDGDNTEADKQDCDKEDKPFSK